MLLRKCVIPITRTSGKYHVLPLRPLCCSPNQFVTNFCCPFTFYTRSLIIRYMLNYTTRTQCKKNGWIFRISWKRGGVHQCCGRTIFQPGKKEDSPSELSEQHGHGQNDAVTERLISSIMHMPLTQSMRFCSWDEFWPSFLNFRCKFQVTAPKKFGVMVVIQGMHLRTKKGSGVGCRDWIKVHFSSYSLFNWLSLNWLTWFDWLCPVRARRWVQNGANLRWIEWEWSLESSSASDWSTILLRQQGADGRLLLHRRPGHGRREKASLPQDGFYSVSR